MELNNILNTVISVLSSKKFKLIKEKYSEQVKVIDQVERTVPQTLDEYIESKKDDLVVNKVFKINTTTHKDLLINHNSQRNNKYSPSSACNVTSVQMQFDPYYKITDDELWILCNSDEILNIVKNKYPKDWSWIKKFFDSKRSNEVLVVLEEVAIKLLGKEYVYLDWNTSIDEIKKEIDLGYSVTILTKLTAAGHFITVRGYNDDKKCLIVNDPWGDWNKNYRGEGGLDGNSKEYSYDLWERGLIVKYAFYIHADKKVPV